MVVKYVFDGSKMRHLQVLVVPAPTYLLTKGIPYQGDHQNNKATYEQVVILTHHVDQTIGEYQETSRTARPQQQMGGHPLSTTVSQRNENKINPFPRTMKAGIVLSEAVFKLEVQSIDTVEQEGHGNVKHQTKDCLHW